MIGSLMSRMGMAEKLSIPQLQQAIQNGTIPAYVGVPLLQQKVQEQKQAQMSMMGQAGQQPTIAQQVMGEAQGIEQAQSNLPAEGFAPGGIINYAGGGMVAFANRGLVDDDTDDDDIEDYYDQKELIDALEALPDGVNLTQAEQEFGIKPESKLSGIEALRSHVISKESGGRNFDEKGNPLTSKKGAKYAMQVMEATAKDPGFGIKPAKSDSPEEYNRVGDELLSALFRKYQDPKLAAAAYNWGTGNVDRWLSSGKGIDALPGETQKYIAGLAHGGAVKHFDGKTGSNVEDPYADNPAMKRILANQEAVNQGIDFGAFGKLSSYDPFQMGWKAYNQYIGDPWKRFISQSPEEQKAESWDVAKEARTGERPLFVDRPEDVERTKKNVEEAKKAAEVRKKEEAKKKEDAAKAANAPPPAPATEPPTPPTEGGDKNEPPVAPPASPASAEQTAWDKYLERLNTGYDELAKQKEQDKYLALLQAGLGMMGGTSPFAAANIGKGASSGLEYLAAANKATAAERAALDKALGQGLYRKELMKGAAGQREATLQEKKEANLDRTISGIERLAKDRAIAALRANNLIGLDTPPETIAAMTAEWANKELAANKRYRNLYKERYGEEYTLPTAGNLSADQQALLDKYKKK